MLELGQELPELLTHIQPRSPESSKNQEKIETVSNVMQAATPDPGDTNEPTTDHAPVITDLKSYEIVRDGYALERKVSDVSISFRFVAIIYA